MSHPDLPAGQRFQPTRCFAWLSLPEPPLLLRMLAIDLSYGGARFQVQPTVAARLRKGQCLGLLLASDARDGAIATVDAVVLRLSPNELAVRFTEPPPRGFIDAFEPDFRRTPNSSWSGYERRGSRIALRASARADLTSKIALG